VNKNGNLILITIVVLRYFKHLDKNIVTIQVQSSGVHGSRLENDEHTCPPDGRRG